VTVVADTSCLTSLLKAGCFELIPRGFHPILVPPAVWQELIVFHQAVPTAIRQLDLSTTPQARPHLPRLGQGEVECILLALAVKADLMLCDDQRANRCARKLGVRTLGSLGVALWAKRQGRISSLRSVLTRLRDPGGLYLSEAVRAEALAEAGE
jgi:uncharacterized protein